jgi:superfamily I DNA/RNA helicase
MDDIKTTIHEDATNDQMLADPGTDKTKTLTCCVLSLILQYNVDPETILLLIFTRLAAARLKDKIKKVLKPLGKAKPQVSIIRP